MLALHGWGMNSRVWEPVREALESRFEVSWLDLPGHGVNRDVEAGSMDALIQRVLNAMPKESHLLGWSLGGLIAQQLAQQQPASIKSLSLIASTPRFSQAGDWPNAMSQDVLAQFSSRLKQDFDGTLKRFIALQFMGIKNSKTIQRELISEILQNRPSQAALELGLELLRHCDFRQSTFTMPTHWMLGGKDRLVPVAVVDDIKKLRPKDTITVIEAAGHAPFISHPQAFTEALFEFIKKQDCHAR